MIFQIDYITNTGLKRKHNEDSILINGTLICNQSMQLAKSETLKNHKTTSRKCVENIKRYIPILQEKGLQRTYS